MYEGPYIVERLLEDGKYELHDETGVPSGMVEETRLKPFEDSVAGIKEERVLSAFYREDEDIEGWWYEEEYYDYDEDESNVDEEEQENDHDEDDEMDRSGMQEWCDGGT